MPRPHRITEAGSAYHLIFRFVARDWFLSGDDERAAYLRMLGRALAKTDWRCFAYALMSSHVHLATLAGEQPLGDWVRRVHSPFGELVNGRLGRIGAVFSRPYDYIVSPDRVARTIAYIHNNPVRAGVVARARDSAWTSHRAYLGAQHAPPWLDVQLGLSLSGFIGLEGFDAWTEMTPGERPQLDPAQIERVRRAREHAELRKTAAGGNKLVMRRRAAPTAKEVVSAVASALALPVSILAVRDHRRASIEAKRAVFEAGVALGVSRVALAAEVGMTPRAISKALERPVATPKVAELSRRVVAALRPKLEAPGRAG